MGVSSVKTVFGLGFDVEATLTTKSGVQPVQIDARSGKDFFGDLRLRGFAALLRLGFTQNLVLVSGMDFLYNAPEPGTLIHEAELIRNMLVEDYGIDQTRIFYIKSDPNTAGNIGAIKSKMTDNGLVPSECAVVSNHYHVPRAWLDLHFGDLRLPMYPAEAFLLVADSDCAGEMIARFGGGPLAERVVQEIRGVADKIKGTYKTLNELTPK